MESVGNSTIQTLGYVDASSDYTPGYYPHIFDGTPEDTVEHGMVHITCHADTSGTIRAMHSIDNSIWDFTDTIPYPGVDDYGNDVSIGTTIHVRKDLKAKWYKTQFEYAGTDPSTECNLRLQTVFHPAATPGEPHFVKLYPTIDVCIGSSIDICVSNLTVSLASDITILNDPLNINIVQQDLSYITVSGSVTIPSLSLANDPIPQVWESDEIADTTVAVSSGFTLYTLHCMNFAPDYRFIKLYDISGTVTISDRPKMTLPVVADMPFNMQFNNGLLFSNALQIRVTRCIKYTDTNLAEEGDVHLIVTYSS